MQTPSYNETLLQLAVAWQFLILLLLLFIIMVILLLLLLTDVTWTILAYAKLNPLPLS